MGALLAVLAPYFVGCTSNPFGGDDDIDAGKQTIRGAVNLSDGSSPQGVYVWLDGFKVGATADSRGQFELKVPPPSAQSGSGGISGAFDLYFYMANYQLATAQVVTQNGSFIYGRGDLNAKGELHAAQYLIRFLRVTTTVTPAEVPSNFRNRVGVTATLEASIDTATVLFPSSVGGLLGGALFRNLETGDVSTFELVLNGPVGKQLIGKTQFSIFTVFTLSQVEGLTVGAYEVIPYILMAHQTVPDDLIKSLAANPKQLGPDYLKIPFRRQGGEFRILPATQPTRVMQN